MVIRLLIAGRQPDGIMLGQHLMAGLDAIFGAGMPTKPLPSGVSMTRTTQPQMTAAPAQAVSYNFV